MVKKFNAYTRDNLHEKLFVHTDKETYLNNEIVWLKVYCVSEMLHAPMALSKVAYLELLDISKTPVQQAKIELMNGKGNGSIDLSILTTGTYLLRAYTRWMRNSDEHYFFEKTITVINAQNVPGEKKPVAIAPAIKVGFFPEGGALVEGLTSVVGFSVRDAFGTGLPVTGAILDQNNAVVTTFSPLTFGLGKFTFTPQSGFQYRAAITYKGETTYHNLPAIQSGGYVMAVKGHDKLSITITRNNPATESDYVFMLAHTRQQVKSVFVMYFKENKATFIIDKNKLGDGVSHITIFDRFKNPVCERLVFKQPVNQLVIESKPQAYQFGSREKVNVSVNTRDKRDTVVRANLSFAMYAIDSLQQAPQAMGIQSYIYLASDLAGTIEQPDFYFAKNDSLTSQATDNLMLTHGWRRFDWKQIINNDAQSFAYAPEYEGQIISGIARNETNGTTADSARVFLSVAGKNPIFYGTKTDRKGNFQFTVNELVGPSPVIFQAGGNDIQLANSFDQRSDDLLFADFTPSKTTEQTLTVSNIHTQVEKAFQNPNVFKSVPSDTIRFYGRPTVSYLLDDYVRFPTLEDVFREYVPNVIVRKSNKKAQLYVMNRASQMFFEQEPLVLVDGMPITNTDMLLSTDANTVKRVNIVNQKYTMGNVVYSGILDVSTYRGNLGGFDIDPKALVVDYEGLQRMRTFNAPDYSSSENKNSRLPDFRNVLHWQPDVNTDSNGNQVIRFYTSDKKGNFIGVIHGMTQDGLMGSRTFSISVK